LRGANGCRRDIHSDVSHSRQSRPKRHGKFTTATTDVKDALDPLVAEGLHDRTVAAVRRVVKIDVYPPCRVVVIVGRTPESDQLGVHTVAWLTKIEHLTIQPPDRVTTFAVDDGTDRFNAGSTLRTSEIELFQCLFGAHRLVCS
jgi:hypothetical protein